MKLLLPKFHRSTLTGLMTSVALVGCATTSSPPGVSVERKSTRSLVVQSAHIRRTDGGVRVWGSVQQSLGHGSTRRSHLDVDVIGPDGQLLRHKAIGHHPFPVARSPHPHRTRGSQYGTDLPEVPPPGSVIRVSHHPVSVAECGTPEQ
jgi:hypothetical protein